MKIAAEETSQYLRDKAHEIIGTLGCQCTAQQWNRLLAIVTLAYEHGQFEAYRAGGLAARDIDLSHHLAGIKKFKTSPEAILAHFNNLKELP